MRWGARQARWVAAWLAGAWLARMFVEMGWVKFFADGFWTEAFARWGYPPWLRILVGLGEVAGGLALLVPWIASYGALTLIVVMLGAWGTRALDGRWTDVGWITVYVAVLAWIAAEWWSWRVGPRARR
ncbi:MAG: DoxX family protein [Gemmatimonadetes bacterium]|nr:DoxX family protein [Gemmatimonadota bacterium]